MIRDWDLWPIYLDQGWVNAESAKRLAKMTDRATEIVRRFGVSAHDAQMAWSKLATAMAAATDPRD